MAHGDGRVPRHPAALHRRHADRRLLVHRARAARDGARSTPGSCEVALITHGESGASRVGMPGTRFGPDAFRMQFESPFGLAGPPTGYALAATRHMHEYGTTSEQLAEVAVATRKWAALNPRAMMRDPLTVDDVLSSRMISWPLHLLDCCLVTDARRRGRRDRRPSARATAEEAGLRARHGRGVDARRWSARCPTSRVWDAARMAGERAFAMAGVKHADIDVAMFYDAFTIVPMMALEALGLLQAAARAAPFVSGRADRARRRRSR